MNNTNGIVRTVERKGDIVAARPTRHTALRKAAEGLSRRNADQAVVELLNEALQAVTALCYEKNDDGTPASVDHVTARILVPVPWGRAGHARWGLRQQEANTLRRILQERQHDNGLFLYDNSARSWFLNVTTYPTLRAAVAYLGKCPIGIAEYRTAHSQVLSGG